ncbi:MAG: YgaP-like transmembrane domain [Bacteroidia bacterium]
MKANLGQIDKILRIIISLGLILLLATTVVSLFFTIITSLAAIYLLLSSAFGSCLFYGLTGLNTKKNLNDKAHTYYMNQKHYHWN